MKTSSLVKISLTTVLALSLATVIIPFRSTAADIVKGGPRMVELSRAWIPIATPATAPVTAHSMSCPLCKNKLVTYDASSKASVKDIRTTAIHTCTSCVNGIKTVGVGKAAVYAATHSCSMETTSVACCN